jgi:hypothetical protein
MMGPFLTPENQSTRLRPPIPTQSPHPSLSAPSHPQQSIYTPSQPSSDIIPPPPEIQSAAGTSIQIPQRAIIDEQLAIASIRQWAIQNLPCGSCGQILIPSQVAQLVLRRPLTNYRQKTLHSTALVLNATLSFVSHA